MYDDLRVRLKELAKIELHDDGMGVYRISAEGLEIIKGLATAAEEAIEDLSEQISEPEVTPEAEHFIGKYADRILSKLQALNESIKEKPRWIPVTERLPDKNQIVVVHEGKGTWDFGMFRGISTSGNSEYWHWKKNTFKRVKWWMPKDGALPDPPKEEV